MTPTNKMLVIGLIHIVVTAILALTVPYAVEGIPVRFWGNFCALHNETFWNNAIWTCAAAG